MEGTGRGRRPPLHVQREFAGSRLEEQILVQVFELVVPVIRRSPVKDRPVGARASAEHVRSPRAKGA